MHGCGCGYDDDWLLGDDFFYSVMFFGSVLEVGSWGSAAVFFVLRVIGCRPIRASWRGYTADGVVALLNNVRQRIICFRRDAY